MPQCASESCGRRRRWWQGASVGVTLDGAWLCSRECVEGSVRARLGEPRPGPTAAPGGRPPLRLGALLRHQRACRPDQIDAALAAQGESHLRLGEQLRAMGAVQGPAVLRALAAQAGVSYLAAIDVERVHDAPGGLPLDVVLALGVLPLGPADGTRMRVAFPAPVPRPALTALRTQTGWTPEPYLVGDDDWLELLRHYGAGLEARGRRVDPPVADADDAVLRLTEAVLAAGRADLRDARWGGYVWLRVVGGPAPVDVVFGHGGDELEAPKEETWPVATTSL
ncbi:MAG: hypothetical protein AB7H93_17945 [Vicinamibacterales bacterium]